MRHGKKNNHLSRTDSHRRALLSNMASSLIIHKRINTTVAKAKALRIYVEPLLTKSKTDSTHNRRIVFSYLQDKDSVSMLFRDVAAKIADRPGGYTRIIKTGNRLGDNADMCFIELVDYNTIYTSRTEIKKTRTTRRGRSSGAKAPATLNIPAAGASTPSEAHALDPAEGKQIEPIEPFSEPQSTPNADNADNSDSSGPALHSDEPAEGKVE